MTRECVDFLNLRTKPGLSGCRAASWILGVNEDWLPVLVRERLLPVAGRHESGCQFYFCTATLLALAQDPSWCDKAVNVVRKAFRKRNAKPESTVALPGGNHV